MITYAIADDHKIFRQGLRYALADDERFVCVGEAADGKELLDLLENNSCQVVLLDLKMPEMGGMEVMKTIRTTDDHLRIVVLTMFEDENFVITAMEAGANGYLLKNADPEEIKNALFSVVESGYYFNDRVSRTLLKRLTEKNSKYLARNVAHPELTDKELLVLQLVCEELTAAEIGAKIFLSTRTVEGIRAALMEKTGSRNIAGLALYAIRNGIVEK